MRENIVKEKSFAFAIEIIVLYKWLVSEKKEFVMSKQLLRAGTSIGAMIREAEQAESRADFVHKLAISLKETNESEYWLQLLFESHYLSKEKFAPISEKTKELLRLLTAIIKSAKEKK